MNGFTEEDTKKLADAINFVTKNMELQGASFNKCIEWTRHMGWLQRDLFAKVEQHVLEVKEVKPAPPKKPTTRKKAAK